MPPASPNIRHQNHLLAAQTRTQTRVTSSASRGRQRCLIPSPPSERCPSPHPSPASRTEIRTPEAVPQPPTRRQVFADCSSAAACVTTDAANHAPPIGSRADDWQENRLPSNQPRPCLWLQPPSGSRPRMRHFLVGVQEYAFSAAGRGCRVRTGARSCRPTSTEI